MSMEKNQQYGQLTVLEEFKSDSGPINVRVQCSCGTERIFRKTEVINGYVTSCHRGLCRTGSRNLVGKRFGYLVVIRLDLPNRSKHKSWVCLCDCGTETVVRQDHLVGNRDKSCGCKHDELVSLNNPRRLADTFGLNRLYRGYSGRAKLKGIPFDLTMEQFKSLVFSNCHYCNQPPSNSYSRAHKYGQNVSITYNGIDRVVGSVGYTLENVVPCCIKCNISKNDHSLDEWKQWIKDVYNKTILNG